MAAAVAGEHRASRARPPRRRTDASGAGPCRQAYERGDCQPRAPAAGSPDSQRSISVSLSILTQLYEPLRGRARIPANDARSRSEGEATPLEIVASAKDEKRGSRCSPKRPPTAGGP